MYGATLLGAPLVLIGFNRDVAWTHTVTSALHFTVYRLDLVKDDPTSYVYDGQPRAMEKNDKIIIYHTGGERQAVGLADVVTPGDTPEIRAGDRLAEPVSLDTIKASPVFKDSPLVKMGRLSVVPLDEKQVRFLMGGGKLR